MERPYPLAIVGLVRNVFQSGQDLKNNFHITTMQSPKFHARIVETTLHRFNFFTSLFRQRFHSQDTYRIGRLDGIHSSPNTESITAFKLRP